MINTIEWIGGVDGCARMIDQTLLPGRLRYINCRDVETMWEAIKSLRIRGAPAIGCAAAFGVAIAAGRARRNVAEAALKAADHLATSRPTAVNLFWALDRMRRVVRRRRKAGPPALREALLAEAQSILDEDRALCAAIGHYGQELIPDGGTVLTHCNAGGLATSGYGTALACIYAAHEGGKRVSVLADETRPLLQGARLTAWELQRAGIEVRVLCDGAAPSALASGIVGCAIVGADRIAANGDVANKVGTLGVALACRHGGVPFHVAAPFSTFDMKLASGDEIPIEERDTDEVTAFAGRRTAPRGIDAFNPAFDVTPARYIASIVTDRGIIRRPTTARVARVVGKGTD